MESITTQKIYRSNNFRNLGGVCSGLALSKGWSITLVRIIALAVGLTTGIGLLAYLVAWVVIPSFDQSPQAEPVVPPADPLMRSKRSRMVAGVCGGLSELFNIDLSLVRIAFVLLVLCAGVGIVPYLYAWIVVPNEP